jgi:4'-phosphopantetheinyl transferase
LDPLWRKPEDGACFAAGPVHVWLAIAPETGSWTHLLPPGEAARAGRFAFPHLRREFAHHHAVLRGVLSGYLGVPPAEIRMRAGEHGKPALEPPFDCWSFNMAHSGPAALVAVARGRELGVDIERRRPLRDARALADRYFTFRERDLVLRNEASFFTLWTRKEAVLKADGQGLGIPLDTVDVAAPAGLLLRRWHVEDLPPIPGHAAALAVENGPAPIQTWLWSFDNHD